MARAVVGEVLAPADSEATAMSAITDPMAGTVKTLPLHSAVHVGTTVLVAARELVIGDVLAEQSRRNTLPV